MVKDPQSVLVYAVLMCCYLQGVTLRMWIVNIFPVFCFFSRERSVEKLLKLRLYRCFVVRLSMTCFCRDM